MPYKNEHAVRYHNPSIFSKLRRKNNDFGDGVHVIYGITSDGRAMVQSVRLDAHMYSKADIPTLIDGLRELGKPIKIEPATKSNPHGDEPLSLQEVDKALWYFIKEELQGIKDYSHLLDALPNDSKFNPMRQAITKIIQEEEAHAETLHTFVHKG